MQNNFRVIKDTRSYVEGKNWSLTHLKYSSAADLRLEAFVDCE